MTFFLKFRKQVEVNFSNWVFTAELLSYEHTNSNIVREKRGSVVLGSIVTGTFDFGGPHLLVSGLYPNFLPKDYS